MVDEESSAESIEPRSETKGTSQVGRVEIRFGNGRVLNVEAGLDGKMLKAPIRSVEDA